MLAAALAIGLTACGDGNGDGDSNGAEQPKPDKITVWRFGTPDDAHEAFMQEVNDAFQQEHGVEVDVQWIPWPDVTQKLQAAAAGGAGPDVTEIGNTQVVTWANQGTLADLTDRVAGWTEGKEIPANLWVNETIDGATYAVPWLGGVRAVIYRKDWFAELDIEVPTTWAELLAAAKTISTAKPDTAGFEINGGSDAMHAIAPFIWGNGGEIIADDGGEWVSELDSPQAREAVQWYTGLVAEQVSPESAVTRNSVDISRRFADGRTAMFVDGAWARTAIKDQNSALADEQIGAFPLPAKDGDPAPQFAGGNDLAVWEDSEHHDLAWSYLELIASKQYVAQYAPVAGLLPMYPDLLAEDTYRNDEWLGPFAEAMPLGRAYAVHDNWVRAEESVVQNMLRDIVQGKKTVDEATADAAEQMTELLNS